MDQKNINFVVKEGSTVTEISLGSKYRWRKGGRKRRRGGEREMEEGERISKGRSGDTTRACSHVCERSIQLHCSPSKYNIKPYLPLTLSLTSLPLSTPLCPSLPLSTPLCPSLPLSAPLCPSYQVQISNYIVDDVISTTEICSSFNK